MVYYVISTMTFSIRHPWMTEMEVLFNFPKVMTFQKIEYKDHIKQYHAN